VSQAGNDRDREIRSVTNRVAIAFLLTTAAGIALFVVYLRGGQVQLEGALLAVALGGLGYGFVMVGRRLLPQGPYTEERDRLVATPEEVAAFEEDMERGGPWLERRGFLLKTLALAGGALGLAAILPIRSLGPNPGNTLKTTQWRKGSRVVDEQGERVRVDTLDVGGVITVFPEGYLEDEESQTLLIRYDDQKFEPVDGREDWVTNGYVAYSKVCTHAGCPVGLYQQDTGDLLCPCHQSTFDVNDGARPTFGPAATPLPQLAIEADADGYLIAQGDYSEPVGPGFWNRNR
jgi:ubiquinol-cytochrome c reductase iron-sulfur subunit